MVALVVSSVSAVVAIVSLVLAFREHDRREEEITHLRGEAGRRDEEIAYLRREGERRDEELGLLATQLQEEQDARREQLRARLVVEKGESAVTERLAQNLYITNTGPHPAFKVGLQLVNQAKIRIEPSYGIAGALMAGDTREIETSAPRGNYYTGPTTSSSSGWTAPAITGR